MQVEPNYVCYNRLYFEQINAERYGWDLGFVAPFISAGEFFKDVVLLEQPSVSDNKKTVKALLDEAGVTVTRFVRFEVGQQ